MMRKYKNLSLTILSFLILVGCTSSLESFDEDIKCITPNFQLAYPFDSDFSGNKSGTVDILNWEPQLRDNHEYQASLYSASDLVVRNDDEIWIASELLLRYTPSTGVIKDYSSNEGVQGKPHTLFVSSDNTLWALLNSANLTGQWLIKYNEESDGFDTVKDIDGLFVDRLEDLAGRSGAIKEDESGIIWLLFDDSLVRFDPDTFSAKIILGREQGLHVIQRSRGLEIADDGSIWFVAFELADPKLTERAHKPNIYQYNPKSNELVNYGNNMFQEPINNYNLLFDYLGRLWVGDYGWLEFDTNGNSTWHKIVRSSLFVINDPTNQYQYRWDRPFIELETMDRYMWFTGIGLVRLDLETEEWCQMSELRLQGIAEDSQHNLWIAGNGQIYKLRQEP